VINVRYGIFTREHTSKESGYRGILDRWHTACRTIHIVSLFSDIHHFISVSTRDESSVTLSIDNAINFSMWSTKLVNNPVDNWYERITRSANWQYACLQRICKKVRQHIEMYRTSLEKYWGKSKYRSANSFWYVSLYYVFVRLASS